MFLPPKHKNFAAKAPVATKTYRGPERRDDSEPHEEEVVSRRVTFDARGNPVLDVRTNVSRRRADDNTIDLLECLNENDLGLEISDD